MNFRLTRDQVMLLETGANLWARRSKTNHFFAVFFKFWVERYNKHSMTGPAGNSGFCFPSTPMFPSASPRETWRVSRKQNSLFPLEPVIKCLLPAVWLQNYFNAIKVVINLVPRVSLPCLPWSLEERPWERGWVVIGQVIWRCVVIVHLVFL